MPTTSPGGVPAGTIRELGLPARAVTVLSRAGILRTQELAALTGEDLAAVAGLGPGLIAAIRRVVPEPGPAEAAPVAPAIPSFDSLRDPRRRTALDLLVPAAVPPAAVPPAGEAPPPAAAVPPAAAPPAPPEPDRPPSSAGTPRPATYADLLPFAVRTLRGLGGCLRRLLGAPDGGRPRG
jgi:hypothetical protein